MWPLERTLPTEQTLHGPKKANNRLHIKPKYKHINAKISLKYFLKYLTIRLKDQTAHSMQSGPDPDCNNTIHPDE